MTRHSLQRRPPAMNVLRFMVALLSLIASAGCSPHLDKAEPVNASPGLAETTCWFEDTGMLSRYRCYYMTVAETPGHTSGRTVSFPVIVFTHPDSAGARSPLLHLGAGGPGASLFLDVEYNVASIYEQLFPLAAAQGRDLVLIDPRGAGQARPRLMCREFVDNVISRWRRNMSIRQSYDEGHENFNQCLELLTLSGMDFAAYSSTTIVHDLELLREALGARRWMLYGASYASVYAQLYARDHPHRIEAMILDSATFLDTPRHEVLVRELTEPYERLFGYCPELQDCTDDRQRQIKQTRFWALVELLDREPVRMTVTVPGTEQTTDIILTGWRFLDSVLWGVYEERIFNDLPDILDELERGRADTLRSYVEELLAYLLDESFGDISAASHYCVDRKPYIDQQKVREQIEHIPYPYARDIALLGLDYADYCREMSIPSVPAKLNEPVITDVPTLFVHGELDSVTLLDHVNERRENFRTSHIVTSSQSHIVLDDPCIAKTAARFMLFGVTADLTTRCDSD